MKNKKLLITGGAGFIGSNLASKLAEKNEIVILDNLSTSNMRNIEKLIIKNNVKFVRGSVTDLELLQKCFVDIDYIFHLAALPSVPRSIKDPIISNEANVTGTLNLLVAARDAGVKKVIYSSSSSVYGDTPTLPKKEDMPLNPLSPYAITKMTGEYYCKIFQELYDLQTIALRYFNVFGPKQNPESQYAAVIPKFISAILNNESPVVFGNGEQSRDFTFVKHVIDANILSCKSDKSGVFNVACGRRITINELIDHINDILGENIMPVYVDSRQGDIKHSLADISKAKDFGYNPEGNFRDELTKVVRWFENESARKN